MFTIKVMAKDSPDYTMYECEEFHVSRNTHPDGELCVLLPLEGDGPSARVVTVPSVAYVMNDQGKTVDVLHAPQRLTG